MTQPVYDIPLMRPRLPAAGAVLSYLEEIDRNRWYTNFGPLQTRLEGRIAAVLGLAEGQVTAVANGTVALTLALMAATEGKGGYCLMPSFTFVATAQAAAMAGMTPWFVDVGAADWALSPEAARAALETVDGAVAAVVPVSVFGAPVDAAAWDAFAEETGVPVVVDAAAGFDGVRVGRAPTMVSLHATKTLAAGEGAIVASSDAGRIADIRMRSNFGFCDGRIAAHIGTNAKMSEYSAAVGLASLDAWPQTQAALGGVRNLYLEAFANMPGLRFAPGFASGGVGTTCSVALSGPDADAAIAHLGTEGIEARQWWGKGCHRHPAFAGAPRAALPVTEQLVDRVVGLPFHRDIDAASIARVRTALMPFLRR